jgi:hypothetical protein
MVKSEKKMCVKCNQTPMQNGKKHKGCCAKCSSAVRKMCVKCNKTPMQNGKKHATCCGSCSPYVKPIVLIPEAINNLNELVTWAEYWLKQNRVDPPWRYVSTHQREFGEYVNYFGLCSGQAQHEIDTDEKRMGSTDRNLMTVKVEQYIVYVKQAAPHATAAAHDTARDGERYCIRKVTKQRLMNDRNGGAGKPPNDKSVGGVFLMVGIKWPDNINNI